MSIDGGSASRILRAGSSHLIFIVQRHIQPEILQCCATLSRPCHRLGARRLQQGAQGSGQAGADGQGRRKDAKAEPAAGLAGRPAHDQSNALASGPVITGSVQPERRADLRAEVSAVVLQVLKENGEPVQAWRPAGAPRRHVDPRQPDVGRGSGARRRRRRSSRPSASSSA